MEKKNKDSNSIQSVQKARTRDDAIKEIRLILDYPKKQTVILLEGKDDKQFWNKMLSENEGSVIAFVESYRGFSALKDLLDQFPNCERVIAVRDKDYSDPGTYPDRMFAYDDCNLEMMLLHRPEVQKGIRQDYEIKDPKERAEIPMKFMRLIAPFSLLRKKCALEDKYRRMNISFGKAGVMKDCGDAKFPDSAKIAALFKCHDLEGEFDSFKNQADALSDEELWNITQGHDLYAILGNVTLDQYGNPMREAGFRDNVLKLYYFSYFTDTSLYAALKMYQDAHDLFIV